MVTSLLYLELEPGTGSRKRLSVKLPIERGERQENEKSCKKFSSEREVLIGKPYWTTASPGFSVEFLFLSNSVELRSSLD